MTLAGTHDIRQLSTNHERNNSNFDQWKISILLDRNDGVDAANLLKNGSQRCLATLHVATDIRLNKITLFAYSSPCNTVEIAIRLAVRNADDQQVIPRRKCNTLGEASLS